MYDGIMPPRAQAAQGPDIAGRVTLPASANVANLVGNAQKIGIVEGVFKDAIPRCVSLAAPVQFGPDTSNFPPSPSFASFFCGILDNLGAVWTDNITPCMPLVLEYGHGGVSNVVYCDFVPGAYNLPPCSWVRVSALPYGVSAWAGNNQMELAAAICRGNMQDAHVPTATGRKVGAGPWQFRVPQHARAFTISGDGGIDVVTVTGAAYCLRDYSTGQFVPGYDPIDCIPSAVQLLTVSHTDAAENLTLTWFLQL